MTEYDFALYLWDSKTKNETKKLLWSKVFAERFLLKYSTREEELSDCIYIYEIASDGVEVIGQYHISVEQAFVEALKKHVRQFSLNRLEPKRIYSRRENVE